MALLLTTHSRSFLAHLLQGGPESSMTHLIYDLMSIRSHPERQRNSPFACDMRRKPLPCDAEEQSRRQRPPRTQNRQMRRRGRGRRRHHLRHCWAWFWVSVLTWSDACACVGRSMRRSSHQWPSPSRCRWESETLPPHSRTSLAWLTHETDTTSTILFNLDELIEERARTRERNAEKGAILGVQVRSRSQSLC